MTSLGTAALTEFYAAVQQSPGGILLTVQDGTSQPHIAGFVAGTVDALAFHRWLTRKYLPRAVLRLLPTLARMACSPRVWKKAGELLLYPRKSRGIVIPLPAAELLSIGVDESHRRQHLASNLYAQLGERFRQQGTLAYRILVGGTLPAAHNFYFAQGAREVARFELHAGSETVVYVQDVPQHHTGAAAGLVGDQI